MKHLTKNNTILISSLLLTLLTTAQVFAQKEYVDKDFIDRGKSKFKTHLKNANKHSEQIIVDYQTLKDIVDQADPSSSIVFFIAGIDKNDKQSDVWSRLNNNRPIKDLDGKQGLMVRYVAPLKTQQSQLAINESHIDAFPSSLKFEGRYAPLMKLNAFAERKPDMHLKSFATVTYAAVGRLCPPPVCQSY